VSRREEVCVVIAMSPPFSGRRQGARLAADVLDQLVPGRDECVGALLLEARGERVDVDAGRGEAGDDLLDVAAVRGQAAGSFVPVEAQSSRCDRAPSLARRPAGGTRARRAT
jgi:hypothetical protein